MNIGITHLFSLMSNVYQPTIQILILSKEDFISKLSGLGGSVLLFSSCLVIDLISGQADFSFNQKATFVLFCLPSLFSFDMLRP